jgi:hypothetical protein
MMAPRDSWIGWSAPQRKRDLQFIVDESRFQVLPWVQVKRLASKILSLSARRLLQDWHALYGYRPLLLETLKVSRSCTPTPTVNESPRTTMRRWFGGRGIA